MIESYRSDFQNSLHREYSVRNMANEKNLKPFKKGEARTKRMGAKGGASTKGLFKLRKDRKCISRCKLFTRCLFQPLSKTKYEGKCALAAEEQPQNMKIDYVKILTGDEGEFITAVKNVLAKIYVDSIDMGLKERRELLQDLIKVNETVWGKKYRQNIQADIKTETTLTDYMQLIKKAIEDEKNKG